MTVHRIFVGRQAELDDFRKMLEEPQGQAALVVGQAGMGKTWLLNKMAEIARVHPVLKCGVVRYEITPTDDVDSVTALMMDHAFEAAQLKEGSLDGTDRRLGQWRSLLNVVNLGDLAMSLRRDPAKNTRDQFLERLRLVSNRMPANGRAVFILDPEKYLQRESDQSWALIVRELPAKIKLIFAQRPDDILPSSEVFRSLRNVGWIPHKGLKPLDDEAVSDLLRLRASECSLPTVRLHSIFEQYHGHPYAIGAALDLLAGGTELEALPRRPEPVEFADVQWRETAAKGEDAVRLFEAYATLEVGVPHEAAEAVSGVTPSMRKSLLSHNYLRAILREEGHGHRIYHSILADYVLAQIGSNELRIYHERAASYYHAILRAPDNGQRHFDDLAAIRLPEHAFAVCGPAGFVRSLIDQSSEVLTRRALHESGIALCKRASAMVERGSADDTSLLILLANIHDGQGRLAEAERELLTVITSARESQQLGQLAIACGNLGIVYQKKGNLEQARGMHEAALEANRTLGHSEMATNYMNLSVLYDACGDHSEAEAMEAKAREIAGEVNYKVMVATYIRAGLLWKKKGNEGLKRAESMFRQALELSMRYADAESTAASRFNLGTVLCPQGRFTEGLPLLKEALQDYEHLGDGCMVARAKSLFDSMGAFARNIEEHFTLCEIWVVECEGTPPMKMTLAEIMARGIFANYHGCFEEALKWLRYARAFYSKSGLVTLESEVAQMIEQIGVPKRRADE